MVEDLEEDVTARVEREGEGGTCRGYALDRREEGVVLERMWTSGGGSLVSALRGCWVKWVWRRGEGEGEKERRRRRGGEGRRRRRGGEEEAEKGEGEKEKGRRRGGEGEEGTEELELCGDLREREREDGRNEGEGGKKEGGRGGGVVSGDRIA